jgi:hypothetical protein
LTKVTPSPTSSCSVCRSSGSPRVTVRVRVTVTVRVMVRVRVRVRARARVRDRDRVTVTVTVGVGVRVGVRVRVRVVGVAGPAICRLRATPHAHRAHRARQLCEHRLALGLEHLRLELDVKPVQADGVALHL